MKCQEQRMNKSEFSGLCQVLIAALVFGILQITFLAAVTFGQEPQAGSEGGINEKSVPKNLANISEFVVDTDLKEVEALKGEVLQLRYDSLDKQMRLINSQYQQLQAKQVEIIEELRGLEAEILHSRLLKSGEWSVNWQEKRVQAIPKPAEEAAEEEPEAETNPEE